MTKALLLFNDVLNHGFDAGHFVTGFAQHLRDVLVSKDPQTLQLLETSEAIRQRYALQAQHCSPVWLFQALDILNTCDINYRTARNKRLTVELALVKLCQLGVPQTVPNQLSQPRPSSQSGTSSRQTGGAASAEKGNPAPAAPAAQAPQPAPSIPKMPKIGLGLGLKKEEKPEITNQQSPITNTPPQEESNRPFTADQLRDAWVGLAATHKEELRLKQLIESYIPHLTDESTAQIMMPNPWQLQEMKKAMPVLLQQLHRALHNNLLQINIVQEEFNQEQMAFTAEEKYALMAEQNPALVELKETLDLQID